MHLILEGDKRGKIGAWRNEGKLEYGDIGQLKKAGPSNLTQARCHYGISFIQDKYNEHYLRFSIHFGNCPPTKRSIEVPPNLLHKSLMTHGDSNLWHSELAH